MIKNMETKYTETKFALSEKELQSKRIEKLEREVNKFLSGAVDADYLY